LTGRKREDEALMTPAVIVIGKELRDYAFALNLNAASMFIERKLNCI